MKKYQIRQTLTETDDITSGKYQYVIIASEKEWMESEPSFDLGIEMEISIANIYATKAEVNYDSLTGTFVIPDPYDLDHEPVRFAFVLDEKGIIFIDNSDYVETKLSYLMTKKKWKMPSLERFIYDFLESIIINDYDVLSRQEAELSEIEEVIIREPESSALMCINEIRNALRVLTRHYDQLTELTQELTENENLFFKEKNIRYFHLFAARVDRLRDMTVALRDYTSQLRELYDAQLNAKQNHIMTVLTVVTTIFMPLTLIAGWYGMNFYNIPELTSPYGYPAVIAVSILIAAIGLLYCHRRKWL